MKTAKGFTLIELLSVVSIIGILAALSTQMAGTYLLNAKIRSTTEEIKEALDMSRAEAIKRNDTVKFTAFGAGGWKIEGYVNDVIAVLKSKSDASGARSVVTADNPVIRFDGSGRSDVAATFNVAPATGSCATVNCLNIQLSKLGKTRVCNPASTNEVLKCD